MKKFLKFLLPLIAIVLLIGCADEGTDEGSTDGSADFMVGYAINSLNDTGQTFTLNAAQAQAEEYGIDLRVEDAEEDLIAQQDGVNTLIQNGVDALIVIPVDTSGMGPITEAAQNAGVPLVYVNRNPFAGAEDSIPENVYYVGSQEIEAGLMQGEYAGEELNGEGGVAILMGLLGNEGALQRTAGVNQALEENYPNMEVLAEETAEWQRDQAINIAENWILTYGDSLNAILANNDEMALGALQAIESTGRDDIIVMGVDAIPDAVDAVETGRLDATVFQDQEGQGSSAVEIIEGIRNGEEPAEQIQWIDFELVTGDNASDYSD